MEDIKKLLIYFRNSVAFSYAWLVLCVVAVSLATGNNGVQAVFLVKLLALCVWGSMSFVFAFFTKIMKSKGFIFDLTVFYILFIPAEVLMFYVMGIFEGVGTPAMWIALGIIIAAFYIASILIDLLVMRRRSAEFTEKLMEYKTHKSAQ